jgi:glycerophosphoryl diester phosphodiesterase
VWTVDNLEGVERLYEMGVTGIISNDPRLFALAESVRLEQDEHRQ